MKTVEYDLALTYQSRSELWSDQPPETYLRNIAIDVIGGYAEEKEPYHELVLGRAEATLINVSRADEDRQSLFMVFDVDQGLADLGAALFESNFMDYRPAVRKRFPDNMVIENILLIRQIVLEPRYRGKRIGLAAMHRLVTDLGMGCGLIILKPYPVEGKKIRERRDRLRRHWEQLGFRQIGRSPYWALSTHEEFPPAQQLGLPKSLFIEK